MTLAYARPVRRTRTPPPKKPGPKPKLTPSPELLKQIQGLGEIGATVYETAVVLGVSERTLQNLFSQQPETKEAHDRGLAEMRMSVRRAQLAVAKESKNPVMLIWLGKQMLGQKDKQEMEIGGGNGGPIISRIEVVVVDPKDPAADQGLIQLGNARRSS